MIYIQLSNKGTIEFQHNMPFDSVEGLHKTEAELLETGYLVESVPEYSGEIPEGKMPELHYDGTAFSWAMVEKPTDPNDQGAKIAALEAQQEATNQAVLGLMDMMMTN